MTTYALILAGALGLSLPALAQPAAAPAVAGYFMLYDDGGEHMPEACEARPRLPALKKGRLVGTRGYLGSRQVEFAARNEAGIDAFQHYFQDAKSCQAALERMVKELNG